MPHHSTLSTSSLRDFLKSNESNNGNASNTTMQTTTTTTLNSSESNTASPSFYWPAFTYRNNTTKAKNTRSPIPTFFSTGESELSTNSGIHERVESEENGNAIPGLGSAIEVKRKEEQRKSVELDEIVGTILYQGGMDSFGPILVLAGSNFPSLLTHDHTILLEKLRSRLETLSGASTYSLVVLASATQNAPTTPLLINSYLALPRPTRKFVRKIFVVGGGFWSKLILSIFTTTLISGKTAKKRKIVQCNTLSDLAKELGAESFTQIEFPLEVYITNSLLESSITLPSSITPRSSAFGAELDQTGESGLPRIFTDCIHYLNLTAASSPGIFRRSPSSATLKILSDAYDRGHPVNLANIPDGSYLAASLLKGFLRRMKVPVLPKETFAIVRRCPSFTSSFIHSNPATSFSNSANSHFINYVREVLLPILSPLNHQILFSLLALLHSISVANETTLMDSTNLSIVLGPSLIGDGNISGNISDEMEMLDMCRVIDWDYETINGRKLKGLLERRKDISTGEGGGDNTVGGVLRGMIECYDRISSPSISRPTIVSNTPSSILMTKSISSSSILSDSSLNSNKSTSHTKMSRSTSRSSIQELIGAPGTIRGSGTIKRGSTTRGEITRGDGVAGLFK